MENNRKGTGMSYRDGNMGDRSKAMIETMAEKRYADMLASAGVGHSRIALEVLFFLPKDFVRVYRELWYLGLGGKDDGGTDARGRAGSETGRLGKAGVRNEGIAGALSSGGRGQKSFVGVGGAKRKSYKEHWVIRDEDMLAIKDRVDKRLRALARDIRGDMAAITEVRRNEGMAEARAEAERRAREERARVAGRAEGEAQTGGETGAEGGAQSGAIGKARRSTRRCAGCGKIVGAGWNFCSSCGDPISG